MDRQADLAAAFKALGDPTRLRLFELIRCESAPLAIGDEGDVRPVCGLTVGEVCCQVEELGQVRGNISYHLKELKNAGLIEVEKRGKFRVCRANMKMLEELAAYLRGVEDSGCCGASGATEAVLQGESRK